jgi:hypothetical protein
MEKKEESSLEMGSPVQLPAIFFEGKIKMMKNEKSHG